MTQWLKDILERLSRLGVGIQTAKCTCMEDTSVAEVIRKQEAAEAVRFSQVADEYLAQFVKGKK